MQWQHGHWCRTCWLRLNPPISCRCPKCSVRLHKPSPLGERCAACFGHKLHFEQAASVGNYQGLLQDLIIRLKGEHDEALAFQFGNLLTREIVELGWQGFDKIIPVPAHWWRKLQRGFLAADTLAESVSQLTGIPQHSNLVRVVRPIRKQGTLSAAGRLANVRQAFEVHPKARLHDQQILIVDDVMTSGATVSELARILKLAGAAEVCVAVIARGAGVR